MKIGDIEGSEFCSLMVATYFFAAALAGIVALGYNAHDKRMVFERLVDKGQDPIALKCMGTIDDWRTVSSACLHYVLPRKKAVRVAEIYAKARKTNGH